MSRLFSLLLVAFVAALVITPAVALRGDDVADLASEASNEEVDFLAAEDAADEQAESGMSLQAEEAEEEAEAAPHQSATPSSSAPAAVAPAEAVTELKKQVKALAATTKDAFALDAFAAEHDEHANAASASTEAKSEAQLENVKIESSSKQTPTGVVVSHSVKVASPTYNPAKHRGQRALRFYCDFKHCHPHGAACFKSCTKLREGQPRIDCHAHCNAVRRKCFNCCAKAKLPQKTNNADDEKTRAERAIAQCNGYTEFCLEYNPPPNVTPDKNWVRSACISIQKK